MGDVQIQGREIVQVGSALSVDPANSTEIDANGLTLLPGVIDPQVHFRETGFGVQDLFTASCACAKGGVTSFLEMPNTRPLTITQEALDDKLRRASEKSLVNYGFFIGATPENLPDLRTANPVCGIKIFMGSGHGALLVEDEEALDRIFYRDVNADPPAENRLIAVHAENQPRIRQRQKEFAGNTDPAVHSQIQDNEAALMATKLVLKLSKKYQRRLHILHLSTAEETELLRYDKPAWVTVEVTPQHLLLNTSAYTTIGILAQMNPPLRSPHDQEVLW